MNDFALSINYRAVYTSGRSLLPACHAHKASSDYMAYWMDLPFYASRQNALL